MSIPRHLTEFLNACERDGVRINIVVSVAGKQNVTQKAINHLGQSLGHKPHKVQGGEALDLYAHPYNVRFVAKTGGS